MSDCPRPMLQVVIAMSLLLLLLVSAEYDALFGSLWQPSPHTGPPRRLERFLYLGVLV